MRLLDLSAQLRPLGGSNAVLGSADVASNAILVDGIDNKFVADSIATGEKHDRRVHEAALLFDRVVVDENRDVITLLLDVGFLELDQDVAPDSLHVLRLADIELEVIPFAPLSQFSDLC